MSRVLAALAARRSAIITALLAVAAVLAPTLYSGGLVGITLVLLALGAGVGAYVTAYAAIGRWEKATAGAVIVGLAALAAALADGLPWPGVVVAVLLAVGAELGLVPALPSTVGSAARRDVDLAA